MRRERPDFAALFLREVLSTGIAPAAVPQLIEIVGVVRRLAERGVRQGAFRRVNPFLFHFALVGSLVFFIATEPARRRAAHGGGMPFAAPDFGGFLRYIEQLTLSGLAPGSRSAGRRGLAPESRPANRRGLAPGNRSIKFPARRRKGARA